MMSKIHTYQTISSATEAEFKDRGSRFISHAYPVTNITEVKVKLKHLKEIHPKAIHFCYAYRIGNNQELYRAVDDGEPSGSAGKPILGQIDSLQLSNVLVIVIRYFGGVLLGVPGLIHAYKTATHSALLHAEIIVKDVTTPYKITCDYTILNEVMRILKSNHIELDSIDSGLFCELHISIPIRQSELLLEKLQQLHTIEIEAIKMHE